MLEALALRNDSSLLSGVTAGLYDEKDDVRYVAAACVIHLSDLPQKTAHPRARKRQTN